MPGPPGSDLTTIVMAIMGGGLFTGVAVAIKVKPERDVLVVTKKKDEVLVNSTVIDDLEQGNSWLRSEVATLREDLAAAKLLLRDRESRLLILEERVRLLERTRP